MVYQVAIRLGTTPCIKSGRGSTVRGKGPKCRRKSWGQVLFSLLEFPQEDQSYTTATQMQRVYVIALWLIWPIFDFPKQKNVNKHPKALNEAQYTKHIGLSDAAQVKHSSRRSDAANRQHSSRTCLHSSQQEVYDYLPCSGTVQYMITSKKKSFGCWNYSIPPCRWVSCQGNDLSRILPGACSRLETNPLITVRHPSTPVELRL